MGSWILMVHKLTSSRDELQIPSLQIERDSVSGLAPCLSS
jgi:hypothetical protein